MDSNLFHIIANLASEVKVPEDGIISRTVFQNDSVKAVAFGFAPGQELSEHTAAMPAIMHFISGKADITVATAQSAAEAGTWVAMEPNVPHSVVARENTTMLLLLIKCGKVSGNSGTGAH